MIQKLNHNTIMANIQCIEYYGQAGLRIATPLLAGMTGILAACHTHRYEIQRLT